MDVVAVLVNIELKMNYNIPSSKYENFSSSTGLIDWKIYKFINAKKINPITKTEINFNNLICVCGFKENEPKISENFFAFFGDFISYEILSDTVSIIKFGYFDKVLTRKLLNNMFLEPYFEEIENELIHKFELIEYTNYEIVNPEYL